MKRTFFIFLLFTAVVFFRGCGTLDPEGTPIKFMAVSRATVPDTKTQYEGVEKEDGEYERIDWIAGDLITLASPQAPELNNGLVEYKKIADYLVTNAITADGRYSSSKLENYASNGLQWGTGAHTFYGMYPAAAAFKSTDAAYGKDVGVTTAGDISAYIPGEQGPSGQVSPNPSVSSNLTVYHPDMRYAYMWCGQYAPNPGSDVDLFFFPMITTFQFNVKGTESENIRIQALELKASGANALCGAYSAAVTVGTTTVSRTHLDAVSAEYSVPAFSSANSSVRFILPSACAINDTKSLTITVFVFPNGGSGTAGYLTNLSIIYYIKDGDTTIAKKLELKAAGTATANPDKGIYPGEFVRFPAGRKINIKGLTLPRQEDNWTFTISVTDYENEVSDVAVAPVEVTPWSSELVDYPLDTTFGKTEGYERGTNPGFE